jgi:hypothetical protein
MNESTVWIWVLVGLLAVAAVVAGWLAIRSPGEGEPIATVTRMTANTGGTETVSSANPITVSAPAAAGTTEPEVESPPVSAAAGVAETADLPVGGVDPDAGEEEGAGAQVEQVSIRDLFDHPDRYDGRTVIVRGKITTLCVRGCRFNLDDGTGVLFVQLEGKALERPLPRGSIGKRIEVRGVFHAAPRPILIVDDPDGVVWK